MYLIALVVGVFFIFEVGSAGSLWLAARHYGSLLGDATSEVTSCTAARDNLVKLATEQGPRLGELVLAETEARPERRRW